jgi:hypothetical protein
VTGGGDRTAPGTLKVFLEVSGKQYSSDVVLSIDNQAIPINHAIPENFDPDPFTSSPYGFWRLPG